ncbi:MAG: CoB--CoM heterodisulfide reductase iron-sulfur subunit A family protein, partial [Candidatus Hydrogenedentes bacterium]|nr:CoB--CoM heterodisulfide reductase iron-sulfur subunit A family protein [Candidatus Hydrogenedentota bacterium]
MSRVGVYLCWCGENIAHAFDMDELTEKVSAFPGVSLAVNYKYMCSDPGQALIRDKIKADGLDGIVVASCSPHMHLKTFRAAAAAAGMNPYLVEMANIREHCSWVHEPYEEDTLAKAVSIIRLAVAKVRRNHALEPIRVPLTKRALVIGGGVAGIQAALDIADGGYQVVLVEREPSIGGKMAGLSETFPTLDCSQCILTPRMVEVGQHPNIKLYTWSEVASVEGFVGNFTVHIRQKARFVDIDKCNGCLECWNRCPTREADSEFDFGLDKRKSIYTPFPQAVPARPVIDWRTCSWFQRKECGSCKNVC